MINALQATDWTLGVTGVLRSEHFVRSREDIVKSTGEMSQCPEKQAMVASNLGDTKPNLIKYLHTT